MKGKINGEIKKCRMKPKCQREMEGRRSERTKEGDKHHIKSTILE
jgi:hypothetical protein